MPRNEASTPHQRLSDVLSAMEAACRRSHRNPEEVALVAVSKYQPPEAVATLAAAGQHTFGENYVQEALDKIDSLSDQQLAWHFIGNLQSNKAKFVPGHFAMVHTLDKLKLAQALHKSAQKAGVVQAVLVQVNIGNEPQKSGVAIEELENLVAQTAALDAIDVQGLMCMPPVCQTAEDARPYFRHLYALRETLRSRLGLALPHLSMGMSSDFEVAIEEGATLVRVGTALFGPRP